MILKNSFFKQIVQLSFFALLITFTSSCSKENSTEEDSTETKIEEPENDDENIASTKYPALILNLSCWEETLPISEIDDNDNPMDIYQPELATFKHDTYFHVNSSDDGVVFRAHCGGVTTSGSGYPRSELREMNPNYTGSSSKASWSTTSGTHTMYIKQAITHLPDYKKHVVAGQIHDANDDVIVFRLENDKLFIDENGNNGPVLTSDYQLGDVFTVKFIAEEGGVKCYYNDEYIYTYKVNADACYFKAGCYTQSNVSKGDKSTAYGEVEIYDLWVSH
ncbi:MAG: polysaccharide lyase family 7 protein [Labilibaculum antarcticum]